VPLLFSAMLLLIAAFGSLAVAGADGFLGPMVVVFCGLLALQGLRARNPRPEASQARGTAVNAGSRRAFAGSMDRSRIEAPRTAARASLPATAAARPFSTRRNIHQPS